MSTPKYEWTLCESPSPDSPFAPLRKIGLLSGAKQRTFNPVRNRAGSYSFQIRTSDPMAYEIFDRVDMNDICGTVRKCVRIRRNDRTLMSGPIWGINGSLDQGMVTINGVGWLETLQKKILYNTADYTNGGYGIPADEIAFGLLNRINSQYIGRADDLPDAPLLVKPGNVFGGPLENRNRYYVLGQALGPALQDMSDIEAGYDYVVDPDTRELNLYNWDYYTTRYNVVLGYNWGPRNLSTFGWQESAPDMCNSEMVISQGAVVGPIGSGDSQGVYGVFEEYNTISGANQTVLAPYIGADLAIRQYPLLTYTMTPYPSSTESGSPTLFDDYDIGDAVFFTARKDAIRILRQETRIWGATVSLDDEENETVSQLQITPSNQ